MTQLTISLENSPSFAAVDYVLSPSNQPAYDALMRWPHWPDYAIWLYGPAHCGKSHLAAIWAQKAGAQIVENMEAHLVAPPATPLLLDPVPGLEDTANAQALFHLLNHVKAAGGHLLLVSECPAAHTPCPLPDLASRIRALPAACLNAPDDALLRAVWFKHFADKQLQVAPSVIDYLVARCERSFAAIRHWAERLDRAALVQKRAVTIPLIKSLLPQDDMRHQTQVMTLRALIVDDNPNTGMVIEFILEELGIDSTTLTDPEAVMEHLKTHSYDLMILDWMMPVLDGLDLLRQLRKHPDLAQMKVAICTARGSDHDRQTALHAGADYLVLKPVSLGSIRSALGKLGLLKSA